MNNPLKPTPEDAIKQLPRLEYVGKILGMDLYVNTTGITNHSKKRRLAEHLLKSLIAQ